jgi:hypothetical protein
MNEVVTKARAVKRDISDRYPVVAYEVWYYTQKSDGGTMENFFIVYEGESSARYWNLAKHIAGKLNN